MYFTWMRLEEINLYMIIVASIPFIYIQSNDINGLLIHLYIIKYGLKFKLLLVFYLWLICTWNFVP